MKKKFNVGAVIRINTNRNWVNAGKTARIISKAYINEFGSRAMDLVWIDEGLLEEDGKAYPIEAFVLVKGKRGRPRKIKPTLKTLYVIYKKGCINYETTIKGSLKEAKKELKSLGDDYVLFEAKPILSCVTKTTTTFKRVKEMIE